MEKRTRNYMLLLYLDNLKHIKALEHIKLNYDYIAILHDRDVDNKTGELKKEHYHVIIRFENARYKKPISEELNVEMRFVRYANSLKHGMLYLVHKNDKTKVQYGIEELFGSPKMLELFEKYNRDEKSETEKVIELVKYIDRTDKINVRKLFRYALNNNLYSEFRRSYTILKDYLDFKLNVMYNKNIER